MDNRSLIAEVAGGKRTDPPNNLFNAISRMSGISRRKFKTIWFSYERADDPDKRLLQLLRNAKILSGRAQAELDAISEEDPEAYRKLHALLEQHILALLHLGSV